MTLSPDDQGRLSRAVGLAAGWHAAQTRKSSGVPYLSHLLQVSGLVLEHGGTVDQAVAGLVHDAVEDTDATLEEIAAELGSSVASIVDHCTDTLPGDSAEEKSPWPVRKARYVERLRAAPSEAVLVAACDKLHNLTSLVAEIRAGGLEAISPPRFSAAPMEQLGFYDEVVDAVIGRVPDALGGELARRVADLRQAILRRSGSSPAAGA